MARDALAKRDDTKRDDEAEEDGETGKFDQNPVRVVCSHCGLNVTTFIEHEASWVTWLVSLGLVVVLQWAALCVVPVVFPLFKDVVHHCPRCLNVLAVRSRVELPSLRAEVMTFRFGSCVVVLARKWVILLTCLVGLILCVHSARGPGTLPTGVDAVVRGDVSAATWEDFMADCGLKSYLGNPIHVHLAFEDKYKNRTFRWKGRVHHVEPGLNFLWWSARGAVYVRMGPGKLENRSRGGKDHADLVLLYEPGLPISKDVDELKRGSPLTFEATMLEAGKRGAAHVMVVWEVHKDEESSTGETGLGTSRHAAERPPQAVAAAENLPNGTA